MRLRGRTDANQAQIIKDLRKMGASVAITSNLGIGAPDFLCGWRWQNFWFECKNPNLPPSARKLTEDERDFHLSWNGQVAVIETVQDALDIMCLAPNASCGTVGRP